MNDQSTTHPDGSRLDAVAIGVGDDEAKKHVATCGTCTRYVDGLKGEARRFAEKDGPLTDDFVRAVRRRERNQAGRRRHAWTGGAISALALAAGLALFVRSRGAGLGGHDLPVPGGSAEGPVRFKGGIQVATVLDHAGVQSRATGELVVEPGDRLRLEIALDHEVRATAGVLADSGEWAELQPPSMLGAGTHYSEQSVTFEHDVPNGFILVGEEGAVSRARATRDFHDVSAVRIRPKQQ